LLALKHQETQGGKEILSAFFVTIFGKNLAFFCFLPIIYLLNCPVARGCDEIKRLKTAFSALKRGLTGIAAWSAQASDRARSIRLTVADSATKDFTD
jgi:hypothetical protein